MKFSFIHVEKAHHSVVALCRNLDVSTAGYYAWAGREPSDRDRGDEVLSTHIRAIHKASRGTYFQLLDYSHITTESDVSLAESWTQLKSIASVPVSVFYQKPPNQHFLRFCFAKNDEVLKEAAEILCAI